MVMLCHGQKRQEQKTKDCGKDGIFGVFLTFCCCFSDSRLLLLSLAIRESSGDPKETESLDPEHRANAHTYL